MRRFHITKQEISSGKIIISERGRLHYMRGVLRLKEGEKVIFFDDSGNEYEAVIEKIMPESIIAGIALSRRMQENPKIPSLTVACALPKQARMDDIIDKLTQLGADKIIPLETARVIVKLDGKKKILRRRRWESIALSAAQQSQRNNIPVIEPVTDIKELILHSGAYDLKLIPTLAGRRKALKEVLRGQEPRNILVLIGPEGDFTGGEVSLAKSAGFLPVTLGDLVLRVDTAAVAVASLIILGAPEHQHARAPEEREEK